MYWQHHYPQLLLNLRGCVLDTYRSSLTPKLVQALICTQDWLRGSPCFDATEDDFVELEKVDLGKNLCN